MVVTAEVWREAHEYHRQTQQFHALFSHGPGILTGLEVIASDPPNRSVYVLPGIAVDSAGRTIVLPEPVAYDFGSEIEGALYLLLGHGESRPRTDPNKQDGPRYVHHEFSLSARPTLPDVPVVELARLTRETRSSPFSDAQNPVHPRVNEIDLRFRREIGIHAQRTVTVAVSYLGNVTAKVYGQGVGYLARALNRLPAYHIVVDDDVPLAPGVQNYTLIYLVGEGDLELNRSQINGLHGYIERGGTLFVESCDVDSALALSQYIKDMGVNLEPLPSRHSLLLRPHLFAAPPAGFEDEGSVEVLVGEGVVFSSRGYGRLWYGEHRDGPPTREAIRSAVEWGANLVAFALGRRQQVG
jgi:hypothetical protein